MSSEQPEGSTAPEQLPLCVALYNGHFKFFHRHPQVKHHSFRVFQYDKIAHHSKLIADMFEEYGETPEFADEDEDIEHPGVEIQVHVAPSFDARPWRMVFFWELGAEHSSVPGLDEPFRELLTMVERMDSKCAGLTMIVCPVAIPKIDGVTKDVSILKIARLYWTVKHMQLQEPFNWEEELRAQLMKQIDEIDTRNEHPAFRAVDFWFIWGAFRDLDNEVVDAMVTKLQEATSFGTEPTNLKALIADGVELKAWIGRLQAQKEKMTWAQQVGGGMSGRRNRTPSQLSLSTKPTTKHWGAKTAPGFKTVAGQMTANGTTDYWNDEHIAPATAPTTILRKKSEQAENGDAESDKSKVYIYKPPIGTNSSTGSNGQRSAKSTNGSGSNIHSANGTNGSGSNSHNRGGNTNGSSGIRDNSNTYEGSGGNGKRGGGSMRGKKGFGKKSWK